MKDSLTIRFIVIFALSLVQLHMAWFRSLCASLTQSTPNPLHHPMVCPCGEKREKWRTCREVWLKNCLL